MGIASPICMEQVTQPKKTSSRRKLALIVAGAVILLAGASSYYLLVRRASRRAPANTASSQTVLHFEPLVVNLSDCDHPAFLRIGIDLAVAQKDDRDGAPLSTAIVRDTLLETLTSQESDDLATPEGKRRLKESILQKLNTRAPEMTAREVYFTEFLIQK